ncbi:molybdenum cofactor guanylyltransferase [Halobellus limi]|jgi:molybdopterin-guanine dinucleotide biosynthesis protein A|uniref:Probable molybdenum cofactor guanylyltransferase n=1 Tax=Halobellus limi TaxID=699433 RepID=A0A1H6B7Z3_9EURY|nr:molybdenum cofactor guanylyltransferase [Halobellus limi]QCC49182.1 molybdenum cofactor guanylyltransferase [Halobellus limi]SEG56750.1 molybdopterin-guanine dinucleotide biosynthesis protein A [Halobellus limi]
MRAALVLAGGRSTRFGDRDKAVADLDGTPMIRRVVDRLAPVVDEVVLNCRADQVDAVADAFSDAPFDPAFAVDRDPDAGPMAGIARGLEAVAAEYTVVVACDMPFVDPDVVEYLFERAAGADAAVPRPDEWYQTTQAVYRTDAMAAACRRALDRGDDRIVAPLDDLEEVVVDADEIRSVGSLDTFENVNTPEEFEAAVERIRTANRE